MQGVRQGVAHGQRCKPQGVPSRLEPGEPREEAGARPALSPEEAGKDPQGYRERRRAKDRPHLERRAQDPDSRERRRANNRRYRERCRSGRSSSGEFDVPKNGKPDLPLPSDVLLTLQLFAHFPLQSRARVPDNRLPMTLRRRLAVAAACAVLFGIAFAAGDATLDDEKPRDAGPARSASPSAPGLALGRAAAIPGLRTQPRPKRAAPYVPTVEEPVAAAPVPVPAPEPAAPPTPAQGGQPAPTPPPATPSQPRSAPAPDSPPRQPQPTPDAAPSGSGGSGSYEEDR
jgi:hypothetical protein